MQCQMIDATDLLAVSTKSSLTANEDDDDDDEGQSYSRRSNAIDRSKPRIYSQKKQITTYLVNMYCRGL